MASVLEDICRSDYSAIRLEENNANDISKIQKLSFDLFNETSRAQLIVHLALLNSLSDQRCICFYSERLLAAVGDFHIKYNSMCKNYSRIELNRIHEDVLLLLVLSSNHPAFSFHEKYEFKKFYDILCGSFSINTALEVCMYNH